MASKYGVSLDELRSFSGIDSTLIDDTNLQRLLEQGEFASERDINCVCVPTTRIDFFEGDLTNRIMLNRNPVLKVRALKISDEDVDLDEVRLDSNNGIVWLETDADYNYTRVQFGNRNLVRVKYDFGLMENTSVQSENVGALEAGSNVSIEVSDSSVFSEDDYVEVKGFDSKIEVFKVSDVPDSTHIVADVLSNSHEAESLLTLLRVPMVFKNLVMLNASLYGAANIIGSSYDIIVSYGLGDMSVNKGVPYPHWNTSIMRFAQARQDLLKTFRPRSVVV